MPKRVANRPALPPEYLVVADKTSKILLSTESWTEANKLRNLIEKGGGEVTIFKSTLKRGDSPAEPEPV